MLQKILLFAIAVIFSCSVKAQNVQVSGSVKDTATKANVKNAVVALITPKDSVLKNFTRVKDDGTYLLKNVTPGKYIVTVSHPNFGDYVDDIEIKSSNESLGLIAMTPKSKLLEAVIVKSGNPIRLKGDTTIYTADSFKVSANANVEELLKKMPGIQVDKNGQIKAMGQTVEKVLVDGEEFFGDDPGMAVKNLRADAVKEVQVFDKKSEQSEFTGIDDGKTQKTINLKLKEDKKKGYFGKVDVAGGPQKDIDDRYNQNILLSSFKGKRKITGFLLNGNTGQDGLSWQDRNKFGGDEDYEYDAENDYYVNRGTGDEEIRIDPRNGFITNVNSGIQYSNKWKDKNTLNFSPKYNSQRYNNVFEENIRTSGDSILNESSKTFSNVNRANVMLKAIWDMKIDTANSLKITTNTNFYETNSVERKIGSTTGNAGKFLNATDRTLRLNTSKQALNASIIFKHKFNKARRTLSIDANANSVDTDGSNIQDSKNNVAGALLPINQTRAFDRTTSKLSTKMVYTEPLNKYYALELGYQLIINSGTNSSITSDFNSSNQKYDLRVDTLSNNFEKDIVQNIPSAKINFAKKKLKINVGAGIGFVNFSLKDITLNKTTNRDFTNFFPTLNFTYTYKSNHNLRVNYTGNTRQPDINDLQPIRDNTNIFYQKIGNPNLQPTFNNRVSLSHNGYNFIKDLWSYQSLSFNAESNAITSNETVAAGGKTTSQSINVNGNYNLNFYGGLGYKLKKIDTRLDFNLNGGTSRFNSFRNGLKNISDNVNIGASTGLNKSKEKKYDVSFNVGANYNGQKSTLGNVKTNFFTNSIDLSATIYYKKVWSVITNYDFNGQQKTERLPAINISIWNAKLQRTFKKDEFTAYFTVRDILNQNRGIDRNFGFNTFIETRNERLQRYLILGFTWNFKNKGAATK